MWAADHRNRHAIRRAKSIGSLLEGKDCLDISERLRFFSELDEGVSHSTIIDIFAVITIGMFLAGVLVI